MKILVIGRHKEITDTIVRLIQQHEGWNATPALTDQEALRLFSQEHFHLVLIGGGVDETSESHLSAQIKKKDADVKIIQHFGGGSGLLFTEIYEALRERP
jgi:DNA-binding response OmpR family regulator